MRRFLDGSVTGWRLLPFVTIIAVTIPAAFFRLESISDARADDLAVEAADDQFRDCAELAKIHTEMRRAFTVVAATFPEAEVLQELTAAINDGFPMTLHDCPLIS